MKREDLWLFSLRYPGSLLIQASVGKCIFQVPALNWKHAEAQPLWKPGLEQHSLSSDKSSLLTGGTGASLERTISK